MGVTSNRNVQIEFSGDITSQLIKSAAENAVSPGVSEIVTLSDGDNAVAPPVITAIVVTALTILPPTANATLITLKGVNGDTGIPLHFTDPTTIALDTTFTGLVLNADGADIVGVRLIWS